MFIGKLSLVLRDKEQGRNNHYLWFLKYNLMTIQNFDKFVDKTLVKQGREVFEKGKVSSIEELEDGLWVATVTDKDSYNYLLS